MPGPVVALVGIFADYVTQVATNYYIDNDDFNTSLTDISYWSLGISGASGFATGGLNSLTNAMTSRVGKQVLVKIIEYGMDVLVNTVEKGATDYLEKGEFNPWAALTGGLIEASIGKFIPLKYVDKLEKKLCKKMNISADKMNKFKNRINNNSNRSAATKSRNRSKLAEHTKNYENYSKAYGGVKTVNDAYKSFGAEALQNIDLYKVQQVVKKATKVVVDGIDEGTIVE